MTMFGSVVVVVLALALAAFYASVVRRSSIDPLPVYLPPRHKAEGVFAHNNLLQGIEKIGVGKLLLPEDIAVDASTGWIYVGCKDGWVKRFSHTTGVVENWVHVGGRPLGLAMGLHGEIIVCEPYQGLLNVTEDGVRVLSTEAEGVKFKLADEVAVGKDGSVYFTDATSKFGYADHHLDSLETRRNGRLLKYDPATETTSVLVRDLIFANGIALSPREDSIIYCETMLAKCSRYWLGGSKKGSTEVFIENLPGFPDNIHFNGRGTFYIALVSDRDWLVDFVFRTPFLRQLIATYPGLQVLADKTGKSARVLTVSEDGKPIQMFEDSTGKEIAYVTSGVEYDGYLYVGGLISSYIGRLKLHYQEA